MLIKTIGIHSLFVVIFINVCITELNFTAWIYYFIWLMYICEFDGGKQLLKYIKFVTAYIQFIYIKKWDL